MKFFSSRVVLCVSSALYLTLGMSCQSMPRSASAAPADPVAFPQTQPTTVPADASVGELESAAAVAVRGGDFAGSDQYLQRAAKLSGDPQVKEMESWVDDFQSQRHNFDSERHVQFEKAVANAHLLLAHKMDSYAIDEIREAYLLSDDRDAFTKEKWVADLIQESATSADDEESKGLWLKAMRMYEDLGLLEPSSPVWKNKLKLATLRVRLLLVYTPDRIKKLQKIEAGERDAADAVLYPTTRPVVALAPTTQPDDAISPPDWHDVTRGVQYDMLLDALDLAARQYYRDVTFQGLLQGGLNGLEALATTDGLEDAFPGLNDRESRQKFLDAIAEWKAKATLASPDDAGDVMLHALQDLQDVNSKTVQFPEEVFVSEFADGAFSKLDVFSTVIWPYDAPELEKTTEGEFGGVGIQIDNDNDGNIVVVKPLPETPAWRAGVRPGDIITRINGKLAKGLSPDGAVKVITGIPGTSVTLTMKSLNGTVKDVIMRREMIKVASIEGSTPRGMDDWNYMLDPDRKIGYIRLTSFSKDSGDDLGKALDELKSEHAQALILDLRYNPGGLLDVAKKIVNKFIDHGRIVSTHADRPTVNLPAYMNADPQELQTNMPLVILVNQYSASASEIVSGALKDQHRALIVGQRTYGKGSVQMLYPLDVRDTGPSPDKMATGEPDDGGSKRAYLKLTTAHYYLPSGRCIHREENSTTWGVDPDVTIEMTPKQMIDENAARLKLDVPDYGDDPATRPTTRPTIEDVLRVDPQLSAALLIMRLQLATGDQSAGNQAAMR